MLRSTVVRRAGQVLTVALLILAVEALGLLVVGPRTGAYRTLTVLSGSMRPTYEPGSVVLVRPVPIEDLKVGDVITYQIPVDDHRVVTHRIVEILDQPGPPVVRTQGDANNAPDPWLSRLEGATAWRAAGDVPGLGYAISALRAPMVRHLLVLACPLLLCLLWLVDLWRPSRAVAHA